MNIQQKKRVSLCAEFRADDGIDPRYLIEKHSNKKSSRKELQLCKEAARILSLVLAGETHNPLLRDLLVLDVQPDGNGGQLCVTVGHYTHDPLIAKTQVIDALTRVQGLLRSALATAIHRKHTPVLSFHYVGFIEQEQS